MRAREKSSISRPWTIDQSPSEVVTGNDEMRPSGTPYEPSETTAIETQSSGGRAEQPVAGGVDRWRRRPRRPRTSRGPR